jgi:hypothetical protein
MGRFEAASKWLKVHARKKLELTNTVKVWRLDRADLVSVRMIAGHAGYPYDFRQTADSRDRISLEDFMVSWEEAFPFAQEDVLDKWKVKTLNAENFNYYIDRTKLAVAGSLSATTTAKLIGYGLLIMEAEHEALQGAWVEGLRFGRPDAQDVVDSLAARAGRFRPKKEGVELDHSVQFCEAVRNPVIKAALSNAAVNRWGLRGKNRSTVEDARVGKVQFLED